MRRLRLPFLVASILLLPLAAALAAVGETPQGAPPANAPGATPAAPAKGADGAAPKDGDAAPGAKGKAKEKVKHGPGHRYGLEKAPPRAPGTLRLAAYNVMNLFDHVDDPALSGEFDDLPMATSDDRCRGLAAAIRALDPDVISLEEVESLQALLWFRDTYLQGMGYDFVASEDVGYYRGVEQSVMSRYPIVAVKTWTDLDLSSTLPQRTGEGWSPAKPDQGTKFQRSPLYVQIRTPEGWVLNLLAVHLKAGGKDFSFQREAEALAISGVVRSILEADPDANLAVMGDFNSTPGEKAAKVLLEPERGGLKGAYDERMDRSLPREAYLTHESGRAIDYILMSPGLAKDVVPKSFFVLGTMYPGDDYDYRKDSPPSGYASDHYPLAIDLTPKDPPAEHPSGTEIRSLGAKAPTPVPPSPKGAAPAAPAAPPPAASPAAR